VNTESTALADHRLLVTGQAGLVARHGQRVLVIPQVTAATWPQTEQLLQMCLDHRVNDASVLLRRAAYLLTDAAATSTPGFCMLVADADRQTRLLVHGAVQVDVPSEATTLSGLDHLTWIERRIADLAGLRVTAAGSVVEHPHLASAWLDLADGVVAGSAVTLEPAQPGLPAGKLAERVTDNQASAPMSTPPGNLTTRRHAIPQAPSFEAVLLTTDPNQPRQAPLPTADQPEEDSSQVLVEGIVCSRGHFNDPGAVYCTVCGISMVQRTHEYVSGPRPPLGLLLFDDGSAFSIDGNYILGREPDFDPAVTSGDARPLTLSDPENGVSRVHAELRLEGWRVLLADRGSSNGTLVACSGTDEWQRLKRGQAVELVPGQHIRFGDRGAVYESRVRGR